METKKATKRKRQTNAEIRADERAQARDRNSQASLMHRLFATTATAVNVVTTGAISVFEAAVYTTWDSIRQRDRNHNQRKEDSSYLFTGDWGDDNPKFDDDDKENGYDSSTEDEDEQQDSVMKRFLTALLARVQLEFNTKNPLKEGQCWLKQHLAENDFWLRSQSAKKICKSLNIRCEGQYYYRDVKVWFPEMEFPQQCLIVCPGCNRSDRVGVHAYSQKTIARLVIGLKTNYYIMGRRHICHHCEEQKVPKYTFCSYSPCVVAKLTNS